MTFIPRSMRTATRLIGAGRLADATRALQAFARDAAPAPAHPLAPGPAPGPGPVAKGAFVARRFGNAAGARDYKLFIPASYRPGGPLLVMLHGCTQSPDDFAAGTRMNAAAAARGCLVAYPAQTSGANMQKCWNWFRPADQRAGAGEPAILAGLVTDIITAQAADPRRVFVAGLSAGGAAALVLAEAYPALFAAVGVHSGLACGIAHDVDSALAAMRAPSPAAKARPPASPPRRPLRAIVFQGDQDKTVAPGNAALILARAGAAGLTRRTIQSRAPAGHAYTRDVYAGPDGAARIACWTVHGAGHAWSGGSPAGTYTDPRGPDASEAMMRFFLDGPPAPDGRHGSDGPGEPAR